MVEVDAVESSVRDVVLAFLQGVVAEKHVFTRKVHPLMFMLEPIPAAVERSLASTALGDGWLAT